METFKGKLVAFWETGTDGVIWCMQEDNKGGYDGLKVLNLGDYVTIFNASRTDTVWQGYISLEYDSNICANDTLRGRCQVVNGWTVNGIQEGVSPNDWLYWFQNEFPVEVVSSSFGHFYGIRGSSLIQAYAHTKDNDLIVKFKDGGFYRYSGVDQSVILEFDAAKSRGNFFIKNIRHKFASEKLEMTNLANTCADVEWTVEEEDKFCRINSTMNNKQN